MQADGPLSCFLNTCNLDLGRRARETLQRIRNMFRDNKAATAIEYGLVAALIDVAAIAAMQGFGNQLKKAFTNVSSNVKVG